MKIAIIQFCPDYGKIEPNIAKMQEMINSIEADIIVFPELCTTGYFFTDKRIAVSLAENANGETINLFKEMAQKKNSTIVYGFIEKDGGKLYNSAAILMPDSRLNRIYRKTHLFYKEKLIFEPGNTGFFVINDKERDLNIGTMICYDWRFPESARALAMKGADIILCPSNLITDLWHRVFPARAIDNRVYMAVANRSGRERNGEEELFFRGESAIWDYDGNILSKAGIEEEKVIFAEFTPAKTRSKTVNDYNDIIKDRREEMYG
jgi:predicted amidohydrolase